jgi:hypothetical protein
VTVPPSHLPRTGTALVAAFLAVALAACQASGGGATTSIPLGQLNGSGVIGTVTLTDVGGGRTRVELTVDPAGHPNMPAHIHPGSCANLIPQPKYPLENVKDGRSVTTVAAPIAELLAGGLAVNVHKSNDDLATYTACADLH